MENSPKAPKLTEEKNPIFFELKILWEVPKFEEIDLEGGVSPDPFGESGIYRS